MPSSSSPTTTRRTRQHSTPSKMIQDLSLSLRNSDWNNVQHLLKSHPKLASTWSPQNISPNICKCKPPKQTSPTCPHHSRSSPYPSTLLPIHTATTNPLLPPSVLLQLISMYPFSSKALETCFSRLPIHIACRNKCSREVVEMLLGYHPRGAETSDRLDRLPIHYALSLSESSVVLPERSFSVHSSKKKKKKVYETWSVEIIRCLLEINPNSTKCYDRNGWLPLHVACRYLVTAIQNSIYTEREVEDVVAVIGLLLSSYPESVRLKTHCGFTPLDFAKNAILRLEDGDDDVVLLLGKMKAVVRLLEKFYGLLVGHDVVVQQQQQQEEEEEEEENPAATASRVEMLQQEESSSSSSSPMIAKTLLEFLPADMELKPRRVIRNSRGGKMKPKESLVQLPTIEEHPSLSVMVGLGGNGLVQTQDDVSSNNKKKTKKKKKKDKKSKNKNVPVDTPDQKGISRDFIIATSSLLVNDYFDDFDQEEEEGQAKDHHHHETVSNQNTVDFTQEDTTTYNDDYYDDLDSGSSDEDDYDEYFGDSKEESNYHTHDGDEWNNNSAHGPVRDFQEHCNRSMKMKSPSLLLRKTLRRSIPK